MNVLILIMLRALFGEVIKLESERNFYLIPDEM